jgi:RNA polymerase-binding transcription factor DksA
LRNAKKKPSELCKRNSAKKSSSTRRKKWHVQAEEERRLARESKMREKKKIQKIQDEMDAMEKQRYLTAMGRSVENMTLEELKEVVLPL